MNAATGLFLSTSPLVHTRLFGSMGAGCAAISVRRLATAPPGSAPSVPFPGGDFLLMVDRR